MLRTTVQIRIGGRAAKAGAASGAPTTEIHESAHGGWLRPASRSKDAGRDAGATKTCGAGPRVSGGSGLRRGRKMPAGRQRYRDCGDAGAAE